MGLNAAKVAVQKKHTGGINSCAMFTGMKSARTPKERETNDQEEERMTSGEPGNMPVLRKRESPVRAA